MKTIADLEAALSAKGIKCMSIRPPGRDGVWRANTRIDDNGWKCGAPAETLEMAILQVFGEVPQETDEMEELLG